MITAETDSAVIGKLFARTLPGQELRLPQWDQLIRDITNIASSANALMCVFAQAGSGKTTFLKMLAEHVKMSMDILHISPASPTTTPGWLFDAIAPWLSSYSRDKTALQKQMASLAETKRPILICLDAGDLVREDLFSDDIEALLNLADSCDLKLSVLICCREKRSIQIATDPSTASRLLLITKLPIFTEEQLISYLETKIHAINLTALKIPEAKFESIAKLAQGIPSQCLRLLAEAIGHSTSVSNADIKVTDSNPKNEKIKRGSLQSNKSRLDDLLAPPKKT